MEKSAQHEPKTFPNCFWAFEVRNMARRRTDFEADKGRSCAQVSTWRSGDRSQPLWSSDLRARGGTGTGSPPLRPRQVNGGSAACSVVLLPRRGAVAPTRLLRSRTGGRKGTGWTLEAAPALHPRLWWLWGGKGPGRWRRAPGLSICDKSPTGHGPRATPGAIPVPAGVLW